MLRKQADVSGSERLIPRPNPFAIARARRIRIRAQRKKTELHARSIAGPDEYLSCGNPPRKRSGRVRFAAFAVDPNRRAKLRAAIETRTYQEYQIRWLPDPVRETLIDDFVEAAVYAWIGLSGQLSGKRAKPRPWTNDILVYDVGNALQKAGLRPTMNPNRKKSLAQRLAYAIGIMARGRVGQAPRNQLFKSMQRAKRIRGQQLPIPKKPQLILGKWQVLK